MEHAEQADGESGGGRKKFSGKKLVLFVVLPLVLLIGAAAGIYFSGVLDMLLGKKEEEHHAEPVPPPHEPEGPPVFYDLPDMLVNLNSTGKRPAFLKIKISIQLGKARTSRRSSMCCRASSTTSRFTCAS
jgi:flagellar FliL protein